MLIHFCIGQPPKTNINRYFDSSLESPQHAVSLPLSILLMSSYMLRPVVNSTEWPQHVSTLYDKLLCGINAATLDTYLYLGRVRVANSEPYRAAGAEWIVGF